MMSKIKLAGGLLLLLAVVDLSGAAPSFARGGGGGSNLFNSPGYQRALQESRRRYLRPTQPVVVYPATPRHRHWRHRRHH